MKPEPIEDRTSSSAAPLRQWMPLLLLLALVSTGVLLDMLGVFDLRAVLDWARAQTQHGWLVAALIAAQVLLFMFGLPGSSMLWLVAPLYPPLASTAILAAGGSLGALAAYRFAHRLSAAQVAALRQRRLFQQLQEHADGLTLLGMRLLPGFPHSVINFSAGVLRLPLPVFFVTALAGFAVKAYLYSTVIHPVVEAGPAVLLRADIGLVLLALAGLAFGARFVRRRHPGL